MFKICYSLKTIYNRQDTQIIKIAEYSIAIPISFSHYTVTRFLRASNFKRNFQKNYEELEN